MKSLSTATEEDDVVSPRLSPLRPVLVDYSSHSISSQQQQKHREKLNESCIRGRVLIGRGRRHKVVVKILRKLFIFRLAIVDRRGGGMDRGRTRLTNCWQVAGHIAILKSLFN